MSISQSENPTPRETTVAYGGKTFHFELLEECAVSDHLAAGNSFYEQEFLEAVAKNLPDEGMIVDGGAHIGNHSIFFAGVLGLRVAAFEPNPEAFAKLESNVKANDLAHLVECHNVALSDRSGTLTMRRAHHQDAGTMAVIDALEVRRGDVLVEATTLDSLENGLIDCVFVKLDLEGHESAALSGASRIIAKSSPMISTEVMSPEQFESVERILGEAYGPVGLFNATPTILFRPEPQRDRESQTALVRYGIAAALGYQQRRDWYIEQRSRADDIARSFEERADELVAQEKFTNALVATVEQLQSRLSGKERMRPSPAMWSKLMDLMPDLRDVRLLVVEFGEQSVHAGLLSLFFGSIDLAHFDHSWMTLTRFLSGKATKTTRHRTYSQRRAGAPALVSLFCEEEADKLGDIDMILFVSPESVPRASQEIVDLIGAPYLAVAADARYEYSVLRFWVGASAVYLKSTAIQEEWNTAHLVPAKSLTLADTEAVLSVLDGVRRESGIALQPAIESEADHRILLISYFAPPTTPVSVQRLRYWHESIPELGSERGRNLEVIWLTATRPASGGDRVVVVPDPGELRVTEPGWSFIEDLRGLELDRLGASWTDRVAEFCRNWSTRFDTVVMSGNPFYYFRLAPLFKEIWGAKVILDFRDPFAWNPRFNYNLEQRAFYMGLEQEMVDSSDAVISVNLECLGQISPAESTIRRVVANGFNEDIVDSIDEVSSQERLSVTRIVYSGTVFRNLPLDDVLDALPEGRMVLEHYGRDYSLTQAIKEHPAGRSHGLVPYAQLIGAISGADAGIVMTSGESSTQTTKLFDYIACDLDIIIVTDGQPRTGNLHEVTQGLDGVFWVRNNAADLHAFFSDYSPTRVKRPQRANFSRRHQTELLLDLILELEGV